MRDLISRQAALDIVFDFAETPHRMYQQIRELPTIDPVKHGKWIYEQHFRWGGYRCSECGTLRQHKKGMNYCPSCGARMERSKDEHTD